MFPEERRKEIISLLMTNNSISVRKLCDTLNASEATIRRDLTILEQEGKIQRTHGGAILDKNINITEELSFFQKESRLHEEKQRIATKAFELINEHDSIVLDSGTTTLELAKLIGSSNLHLTVITNSTMAAHLIAQNDNVDLYTVGGKIRLNTLATVGNLAIESIKKFNVNKAFIGINAITVDNGLTTPDLAEAEVKNAMMKIASEVNLLTDHSKFNKVALCQVSPVTMVDRIITDTGVQNHVINEYLQHDIEVICV